jgi:hypothetical protein
MEALPECYRCWRDIRSDDRYSNYFANSLEPGLAQPTLSVSSRFRDRMVPTAITSRLIHLGIIIDVKVIAEAKLISAGQTQHDTLEPATD